MQNTSLDEYFDIIDSSTATYFLDKYGVATDLKENRFLRSCVIDLIKPHIDGCSTVLDAGVGQGVNSLFFLKNGNIDKLIGLDNDPKVLSVFLQNAGMLGVDDKAEALECDLIYGLETSNSPDCILCMDILYGDPSSVFGKNSGFGSLRLDNKLTIGALSDTGADKIIVTRLCGCTIGTCMNPYSMKQDLEDAGYLVTDFGSKVYGSFALDYAISRKQRNQNMPRGI